MFAAVELGIFDGARPQGAAVERLLEACVALGLLERRDEQFVNTAVAEEYLRRSSPRTLAGYIRYSNSALYKLWEHLEDAAIEGTDRWEQSFGSKGAIFSHLFRTDDAKRDFLAGMHGFGMISSPAVAAAFDLSKFRRIVDLGGATGHLALAVRDRYPHIEAAVFDLPAVIEVAKEYTSGRADLIAGDFFTDPLPAADLYSLGRILHDWSEDKNRRLLDRIYAALPSGGGLLVAERLLDEDHRGPLAAHMQSLNMLVCTEGRERSLEEYRVLLGAAGFSEIEGGRTGTPLDAVLAMKNCERSGQGRAQRLND